MSVLLAACAADSPDRVEPRTDEDAVAELGDAGPDYAAVFGTDTIHQIALRMDPADHAALMDDMAAIAGMPFGAGRLLEQMTPDEAAALVAACDGRVLDDACDGVLGGDAFTGLCQSTTTIPLLCLPSGFAPHDGEHFTASPAWFPVEATFDGETLAGAGYRLKGNSTLAGPWQDGNRKLPFRLDFDRFAGDGVGVPHQRLHGFGEIALANGYGDPTLMRDVLASGILEDRGVPAARAGYAWVTLDIGAGPEPVGLYVMLEDPSDTLLDRVWGEHDGNLYKPEGDCATVACFDEASFSKETNAAAADWSDVQALYAALYAGGDATAWRAGLEAVFDVDGFLRWLAVNSAMRNWDAYGAMAHNYFLYGPTADGGRLTWIPWDQNEAILDRPMAGSDPLLDDVNAQWPLIRRLLDDPVYRETYRLDLLDALDGAYAADAFDARVEELRSLLTPALWEGAGEPADATFLTTRGDFDASIADGLVGWADTRRAQVAAEAADAR